MSTKDYIVRNLYTEKMAISSYRVSKWQWSDVDSSGLRALRCENCERGSSASQKVKVEPMPLIFQVDISR